ncbi:nuclear transport factor 2 family protein [Pseudomonas sp. JM0905a]|uniref:Nuclear transport factor 2 family protein n=1 Tax=Metapseudomonas resinovorans TaxID=53412 RepID=A0ABT4Y2T4_METRE|nr:MULTISPECIES: nuclear transport factor 2 family protein [Pseudomonas]MBD2836048.1 nuclear transport factor 2 family protein [Pseudomonas sp. JM0905a]MDA8483158.1 nuclear transport factor 2 family protein [Pseudomonas resinovorans]
MSEASHKQALYELVCRYAQAVDKRDWQALARLFTPDAVLKGPGFSFDGVDAIVAGMNGLGRFNLTQHHVHNHLAEFDELEANAETYCVANHLYEADGLTRKLDWGIRYLDRFACIDGLWHFTRRELLLDWSQDLPLQGPAQ